MKYRQIIPFVAALTFGSCAKKEELPVEVREAQQEVQQEEIVQQGTPYDARFNDACFNHIYAKALEDGGLLAQHLVRQGEEYLRSKGISAEIANAYAREFDTCAVVSFQKHEKPFSSEQANAYASLISLASNAHPLFIYFDVYHLLSCTPPISPTLAKKILGIHFSGESNVTMTGEEMCTLKELEPELADDRLVDLIASYDHNFSARETLTLLEENVPSAVANRFKELEERYGVSVPAENILQYLRMNISFTEIEAEARRAFIRRSLEEESEEMYGEESENTFEYKIQNELKSE